MPTLLCVSILEAVLTVSPKRQYCGILFPTTPATTLPVCIPEDRKKYIFPSKINAWMFLMKNITQINADLTNNMYKSYLKAY